MKNPLNLPASYGYIITVSREINCVDRCPITAVSDDGEYDRASMDGVNYLPMAVYPTKLDADQAMERACKGSNPLVYDGMRVSSLKHSKLEFAHMCAFYGNVTYPVYQPKRTDYSSAAYLD